MKLCSFSNGIAQLEKHNRTEINALKALRAFPKISTWDMEENWLRAMLDSLLEKKLIVQVKNDYPFFQYQLTVEGKEFLESLKVA